MFHPLYPPFSQASLHPEAMVGIKVDSVGSMRPKGKSYDINVFQVSGCDATVIFSGVKKVSKVGSF